MRDLQTLREQATDFCSYCGVEYTLDNNCCCDDSLVEYNGKVLHLDGICVDCHAEFHRTQFHPTPQHERGE